MTKKEKGKLIELVEVMGLEAVAQEMKKTDDKAELKRNLDFAFNVFKRDHEGTKEIEEMAKMIKLYKTLIL